MEARSTETPVAASPLSRGIRRGISARAVVLALLIAPINSIWLHQMNEVQFISNPTVCSLYFNVVLILCLFVGWNRLIERIAPKAVLRPEELLVIYMILVTTSSSSGYDFLHWILPGAAGVHHAASPVNRWEEVFFSDLPRRLTVSDPVTLKALYEGGTSFFGTEAAWRPWVGPATQWSLLMVLTITATLGLSVLLRRRWMEVEKLPYPIVQLPWELTRERSPFFRDRALWWAFGVTLAINLLNGMHVLKPAWPMIPVQYPGMQAGSEAFWTFRSTMDMPWGGAGDIGISFFPIVIGFGLILPTELLASTWVFFLLFRLQLVLVAWLGLRGIPDFPYQQEQAFGGFVGILLFSLWTSRGYLRDLWRRIVRPTEGQEAGEPVSARAAALWTASSLAGLIGLTIWHGMGWWQSIAHWAAYFLVAYIVGRVRAEMGLFTHELYDMGPTTMLGTWLGKKVVGARSLTVASVFYALSRGFRSLHFPHQAEAYKLGERAGLDQRKVFRLLLTVGVFSVAMAWLVYMPIVYRDGAATARMQQYSTWYTDEAYGRLMTWLEDPKGVAGGPVSAIGVGAVFYLVAIALKMRFEWWPIHPLGFALAPLYAIQFVWFALFLAWVAKWIVTRYTGHEGLRRLTAIAYGLILADSLGGGFWAMYGSIFRTQGYKFMG